MCKSSQCHGESCGWLLLMNKIGFILRSAKLPTVKLVGTFFVEKYRIHFGFYANRNTSYQF